MQTSPDVPDWFEHYTTPPMLTQEVAILVACLLALFAAHFIRLAYLKRPRPQVPDWTDLALEAGALINPPFVIIVLLLAARGVFTAAKFDSGLLDIALQLAAGFAIVRLVTFALRLMMGPRSWFVRWEKRLTWVAWIGLSTQMLGWLEPVRLFLDSLDLAPGERTKFSLWMLMESIVVVTLFVVVASLVAGAIERRVMRSESVALSTRIGISKSVKVVMVGLSVLLGLNAANVDITALTVLTGAVGLGLGFGLQSIAANFVSGFVLLIDKSIKPGDVISFTGHTGTSTENFGWVQELRGRYVVVRDRDGVETLVPNQNLITNQVINWSYSDRKVRLKLPVRMSYGDDPELALAVLLKSTTCNSRILQDPPAVSRLMGFADHGMELELRFWIADPENGVNNVRSDVNRTIYRLFKEHGIAIPVAQREVHVTRRNDFDPDDIDHGPKST
ncbi:MAG TPA: mechanosensitive ion channel domain-containing protein [Steroidobacteraceae bacterium]|nr:mechanosensitive ion channel domain-containing protein [Steroidobacteraceae bacterium]